MLCQAALRRLVAGGRRYVQRCLLFTDESLGLVSFDIFRRQRRDSAVVSKDELFGRLEQFIQTTSGDNDQIQITKRPLIFSEDVLQAIAVTDTREEANRLFQIVGPFVKDRVDGGQYRMLKRTTAPVAHLLMKLFHRLRHHELAFIALASPDDKALEEFFGSDLQCYQIGIDLLYETRQYQEVMDVWDMYERRRRSEEVQFSKLPAFPRSLQILVLAACYKLNTPVSLQYAMKFVESGYDMDAANESHHQQRSSVAFTRKALALASALAANQNETELAFEFLSVIGHEVVDAYTAPRTLKCILLTKLGRWPELLNLFKRVLESDVPSQTYQDREISIDAIRAVETAMGSINNKEIMESLKRCCLLLRRGGHVVDTSLDALLCAPVQIVPPSLIGQPTALVSDQRHLAIGSSAAALPSIRSSADVERDAKEHDEDEKNIWETSSVYEDDSSAIASAEKFQENERRLRKLERRKKKILNTVGKWIREEGPLEVGDGRAAR